MKVAGIEVASFFPGRVKLKVEEVSGDAEFAGQLEDELAEVPGIKHVAADAKKGTVLIKYEKKKITQPESIDMLADILRRLFPHVDVDKLRGMLGG
jgi:copper chaperone CopZ